MIIGIKREKYLIVTFVGEYCFWRRTILQRGPRLGVVSGMRTGLGGFINCQLSVLVNISFSYSTIFLSSVSRSSPVNSPSGEFSSFLN